MKPQELRIGNWVYYHGIEGPTHNVNKIDATDIQLMDEDEDYLSLHEPIPLTEEWLKRFGLKKLKEKTWKGNGYDWQPETSKTEQQDYGLDGFIVRFEKWSYRKTENDEWIDEHSIYIVWDGESILTNKGIEYVHQLQNLFYALTGNELKETKE